MGSIFNRHCIISLFGFALLFVFSTLIALSIGAAAERVLTVFFISLIAVIGMGLYSGNSGILSFGHLAFMAIGAYASSLLTLPAIMKTTTLPKLPLWFSSIELGLFPALLMAICFTMIVALIIGLAIGKLEGSGATIATLGLLIIVHGIIIGWRDVTRGSGTFFGVPRQTDLIVAALGCFAALGVARFYRESSSGLRLRASRENAIAASAVGVNIRRERLLAWVLSAALMALAGALLAHFLGAFSPKKFYFVDTFLLLAMLIVGGMTTITGAVSGAILITIVSEVLRRLESGFDLGFIHVPQIFGTTQIGIAAIILIAMFKKAEGIAGLKEWEERLFPNKYKKIPITQKTPIRGEEKLVARKITQKFGGLIALNEVDIKLKTGEILGLIGPNGSGKTTLLNVLSGINEPSSGSFEFANIQLNKIPSNKIADYGIARTFQNIRLFSNLTVYQNIETAAISTHNGANALERVQSAIERLEIGELAQLDAGNLSYGDQRRVEIARALACQPKLLFLDEPAAGMNREETDALMAILRKLTLDLKIGVLLVDHDLKLINQLCDRIIVLNEGKKIAMGTPEEIRNQPEVIEAYLGKN